MIKYILLFLYASAATCAGISIYYTLFTNLFLLLLMIIVLGISIWRFGIIYKSEFI